MTRGQLGEPPIFPALDGTVPCSQCGAHFLPAEGIVSTHAHLVQRQGVTIHAHELPSNRRYYCSDACYDARRPGGKGKRTKGPHQHGLLSPGPTGH